MSAATEDELVVALARATVERAAPEELVIFPAASEAYLEGQDPTKATRGDPMLGFGVETAVVLLTPIALTVAKDVLGFLRVQLKRQTEEHGDEAVDWLLDKLLRRGDDEPAPAEPGATASPPEGAAGTTEPAEELDLTEEQLEQVRALALEKAKQLKLSDAKAELLADGLVGSLATV
jgi:hypothetical protein